MEKLKVRLGEDLSKGKVYLENSGKTSNADIPQHRAYMSSLAGLMRKIKAARPQSGTK